ncbi:MAG: sigma-54-dependent Fis family transcriptional regulator [Ignavibacteriales bacterium]|nr:sigma-54-dependent Fis family transcriptional regulator [Ignavibacteriales bacterium]
MASTIEIQQRLQKLIGDSMSTLSAGFMDLSAQLKVPETLTDASRKVDKLFHIVLDSSRLLTAEINTLVDHLEKTDRQYERLNEERRRLEVLYASGILFSSETEMRSLMEKAIDTVVKELSADAGFIVLVNNNDEVDSIFSRNMDPENEPEAKEMSMTVIRTTISQSKPTHLSEESDETFAKQQSVIRLGITAALCVPLISKGRVLGTVYLDRRNREKPFIENDLIFLLSFAKQIVRGLEVSLEISSLEKRLILEASMKFEDLRKEFKCENIIGSSKKLFELLKLASKIAPTDASVVLLGENGTGKDLLATAIHQNSRRASKPFVIINCSAIPADLLESELFGYESGAFTGATRSKPGKLELADGGTVFFDEIGEMSVNLQAKLLRVLQTKELERLGSVQTKKVDIRILAATNRNIQEMISAGSFREDLYYRLKIFELTVPPLRERREDIIDLAEYFLTKYAGPEQSFTISEESIDVLEQYSWPGNVRELENVIQRALVLVKTNEIQPLDLPPELLAQQADGPSIKLGKSLLDAETEFRRWFIIKTLRKAKSNTEAAQMLGINRTHFYKLLSQLDIQP